MYNDSRFVKKNKYTGQARGQKQFISTTTIYNKRDGNVNISNSGVLHTGQNSFHFPEGVDALNYIDATTDVLYVTKTMTKVGHTENTRGSWDYSDIYSGNKYMDGDYETSMYSYDDETYGDETYTNENDYESFNYHNNFTNELDKEYEEPHHIQSSRDEYTEGFSSDYLTEPTNEKNYDDFSTFDDTSSNTLLSNPSVPEHNEPKPNTQISPISTTNVDLSKKEENNSLKASDVDWGLDDAKTQELATMAISLGVDLERFKKLNKETVSSFEQLNDKYKECLGKLNNLIATFREKDFPKFDYDEDKIRNVNESELVKIKYDFRDWVEKNKAFTNEDFLSYITDCIVRVGSCIADLEDIEIKIREYEAARSKENTSLSITNEKDRKIKLKRKEKKPLFLLTDGKEIKKKKSKRRKIILWTLIPIIIILLATGVVFTLMWFGYIPKFW